MNSTSTVEIKTISPIKNISIASLQIIGFAALTALCAQVKIPLPFTPVPLTLQTLAVVLSGAVLGSRKGALSQIALIASGTMGLQVFSQAQPGYSLLMGPTGGYIIGFVIAAYITGLGFEKLKLDNFMKRSLFLFIASFAIFFPGVIWLKIITNTSFISALTLGFVPFLIGDIIKTIAACSFLSALDRFKN